VVGADVFLLLTICLLFVQIQFPIFTWAAVVAALSVGTTLISSRFERGRQAISILALIDIMSLAFLNWIVAYVALLFARPERKWVVIFCLAALAISIAIPIYLSSGLPVRDGAMPLKGRWLRKMLCWLALFGIVIFIPTLISLGLWRTWWLAPLKPWDHWIIGIALISLTTYLAPLSGLLLGVPGRSGGSQ
jgi:hypothetical protein